MIPLRNLLGALAIGVLPSLAQGQAATNLAPVTYAGETRIINSVTYPAVVPDDGFDDTIALQAAIDDYLSPATTTTALVLPRGVIEISSTITIDSSVKGVAGLRIIGAGNMVTNDEDAFNVAGTIIKWTGTDGTMLQFKGATGVHMSDVALWGDDAEEPAINADIGIQIQSWKDVSNHRFTSSYYIFDNVGVNFCDDAVSCGGGEPVNAADMTFNRCSFYNCGDGLVITQEQSVDFGLYDCVFFNLTNVVNIIDAGGNVWLHGPLFHTCERIFYVQDGSRNAGWLSVLNGKIDGDNVGTPTVGERLRFLEQTGSADGSTVRAAFRNIGSNTSQISDTNGTEDSLGRLILKGNAYVLLENCEMLCAEGPYAGDYTGPLFDATVVATPAQDRHATIHIRGCELPADPSKIIGTVSTSDYYNGDVLLHTGRLHYQIENCFESNKNPIPDYDSAGWGTRDFGARADTPSGEGEKDGDTYFDTDLGALFQYDGVREKWLSVQTFTLAFTEDALYNGSYLPMQNLTPTASEGPYVPKCTLVQASISQVGTIGTSLEWMQAGSQVGSDWVINGVTGYDTLDGSLDVDFAEGNFSPRRHSAVEMTMGNVTLTCTFRLRP